jgi:hypothetical protein
MSDAELAKYKALMEEDFRKHQLKPGDDGYEYDKQVCASDAAARMPRLTAEAGGVRARYRGQRLGRERRRQLKAGAGVCSAAAAGRSCRALRPHWRYCHTHYHRRAVFIT